VSCSGSLRRERLGIPRNGGRSRDSVVHVAKLISSARKLEPEYTEDSLNDRVAHGERISLAWSWMKQHRRDLPWRHTRDPWAILVAELMLQQTQVSRVLERWPAFLQKYPTPEVASLAGSAALVTAWSGLGYNRRALALHRCATIVSERHNGKLPHTLSELLALPGIGQYTARAVMAFAFATPAAVVDTNVARILSRSFAGRPLSWREVQDLADSCVPPNSSAEWVWGWNQGLLDFGATICTKRSPRCHLCPIQTHCAWQRMDAVVPDPAAGSAGVGTGQSRFEGSDRQGRGRLIEALREAPVPFALLSKAMGWPEDPKRADRVVESLLNDGLVQRNVAAQQYLLA
jgi:A/G-specific adenine glycosylase